MAELKRILETYPEEYDLRQFEGGIKGLEKEQGGVVQTLMRDVFTQRADRLTPGGLSDCALFRIGEDYCQDISRHIIRNIPNYQFNL